MFDSTLVWVLGAGELGSAVAVSLWRAGIPLFLTELPLPLAIRRTVTFSDAILEGTASVEEVTAVHTTPDRVQQIIGDGQVPLITDSPTVLAELIPDVLVDARMLKGQGTDPCP
ncbi:MAG: molybdenum hydroxylase, partial [Candidatus Neomarinimicrobiota bacterium]